MTTSLTPSPQRKRGSTAIGRRQTPNRLVQGALLGAFVGLLGAWLSWVPFGFDVEERLGLDQLFLWRGTRQPPEEVIIIGIDARSATKAGWPSKPEKWPRGLHAELIRKLTGACAKVIVYDLFFAAARDPEQDRQLARALREAGNVVLVSHLGIAEDTLPASLSRQALQIQRKPLSLFAKSAVGVAPLPLPNEAGGVTGLWLFKPDAGDLPSLPALAFHVYAREAQEEWLAPFRAFISKLSPSAGLDTSRPAFSQELTETMRWLRGFFNQERTREQARVLSAGEGGRRLLRSRLSRLYQAPDFQYLNFFGPARSVTTVDFPAALALSDEAGECDPKGLFSGKAVFVGVSETSPVEQKDRDIFDTAYTDSNGLKLSGVEIAATAFANLLEDKPVRRLPGLACLAILALFGVIAGLLWCGVTTAWALGISVVMMTGYFWLVFSLFSREAFWLPWIVPSVQLMIAGGAGVAIERRNLQRRLINLRLSLAEWLPPRVVAEIASDPAITRQATGLVYGTCLSIKVDGSLMGSENTDPIVSSQLMSDCFRLVDKSVTRYGGVLAEQTRHSRLSLWVATKPDSLLRRQACRGALNIQSEFGGFQRERNCHSLSARIGLHAGRMAVDTFQSGAMASCQGFGVIIDSAEKIEALNAILGTQVLASREVIEGFAGFHFRRVGTFAFPELVHPIEILEILGCTGCDQEEDKRWLCVGFGDAHDAYQQGDWQACIEELLEILARFPEDGPSHFYLRRCEFFKRHPPIGAWEPIIRL